MKNRILAVCDPEEAYVSRLMEYLNENQVSPFYVRAFTSREALREFAAQESVEVLLISADEAAKDMQGLQAGKKILLTKGEVPAHLEGMPAIYKYQSAEKIIRETLCYYAEEAQPFLQATFLKKDVRMYGVYSPIQRAGKTSFALALGSVCAGKKRTLYLNLEAYSGFSHLLLSESTWNLGDLLFFLKRGKLGFLYKLKSVTQSLGNLDYISPVFAPEDLLSVTEEEWEELLERLISDAGYECLIVDFSDCVCGLLDLLSKCSRIYMPVLDDRVSQAKLKQFEELMERKGTEYLRESICKIRLPKVCARERSGDPEVISEELRKFAEDLEDL